MDKVLRITTFADADTASLSLACRLSRPPEERVAEVDRLRAEYYDALCGGSNDLSQGLAGLCALLNERSIDYLIVGV